MELTPRNIKGKLPRQRITGFIRGILKNTENTEKAIEVLRVSHIARLSDLSIRDRIPAEAVINVFADLAKIGWVLSLNRQHITGTPRKNLADDDIRIIRREQLSARRHEQLRERGTRDFVSSMEAGHVFRGRVVSIFNLMRDGRDLASALERYGSGLRVAAQTAPFISPYLQFVERNMTCSHSGYRLQDIWRYFRYTWASAHESVPGRSLLILVRDSAAPFHPVIGIAALSSAASVLPARDAGFIGWSGEVFLKEYLRNPRYEIVHWLKKTVHVAIIDIYRDDFIAQGILPIRLLGKDTSKIVARLRRVSMAAKEKHIKHSDAREYKRAITRNMADENWEERACTDLFRSKRALELASLLEVQSIIASTYQKYRGRDRIRVLCETRAGREAIKKVVRIARSRAIGTAIADLTVCGAIAPYNEILGGKLVAMLSVSPDVVREYRRRYSGSPSVIASSMAGRRVVRSANLVYIGTTSLYGKRPSQYDRISIPVDQMGGKLGSAIRYKYLGDTEGLGTTQFGGATRNSLERVLRRNHNGVRRVNNVFGEGANPKLRALRDGIASLGLSEELMIHGLTKSVYGVSLIENLCDYLLGINKRPKYFLPVKAREKVTQKITAWWYKRWVADRCHRPDVLDRVVKHTLIKPVSHGGRVSFPDTELDIG